MKKILVTYRLLPEAFSPYQQKYDLIFPTKGSFSENAANSLNSAHLPSITGIPAAGPMSPRPRTAVPFVITATRLPFLVPA